MGRKIGTRLACLLALVASSLPGATAMAQGIGPSSGPFRFGPPRPGPDPVFVVAEVKAGMVPNQRIVGLNQFNARGSSVDFLGARYYLAGRATVGITFDTPFLKGAFGFFGITSTHGENYRYGPQSWSLRQVAWVRRYGAGVVLPRQWLLYAESRGRWAFPDRAFVEGPFEIYNILWAGKGFEVRQRGRQEWFFKGYLEGGLTLPHNEIAFNIRRPHQPETEFFGDNYARYALRGTLQMGRSVDAGRLRQVSVYVNPFVAFGRNVPQQEYTWEGQFIAARRCLGIELVFDHDWRAFGELQFPWNFRDHQGVPGTGPFEEYLVVGFSKAILNRF